MLILDLLNNPIAVLSLLGALLVGLSVHEWAHARSAFALGDPTAYYAGRMTLNPARHIDPVGALFFLVDERVRYAHFVWHLFVLAGSTCHFLAALWYGLAPPAPL